jgi:C-terminal processing protease CtpA/Prc
MEYKQRVQLTLNDRKAILNSIRALVPAKHINVSNPHQDYAAWIAMLDSRRSRLETTEDTAEFERGVREMLSALGSSHTAFFRMGDGVPPVHAIHATLRAIADGAGAQRWMFLDVIEDGPAHHAGICPGELLAAADGESIIPPAQPRFHIGGTHRLEVVGLDGTARLVNVEVPNRRAKDRPPMVEPRSITHRMVAPSVGLLKVASFPGAVGMGFAKSLDAAIADLKQQGCNRLIVDLRGNVGGGLGSLRLMSYLCPGKLPVGYSLTRNRLRNGFDKERLIRINRIPAGKADLLLMAVRFKILHRDRSMVLETEGLGPQPFHGRIAILVNEFTNSAAEMVASFAAENKLATLIGTRTGGQVLGGANFKLAKGYRLRMPVAGWYTWRGKCIEGRGIAPDIEVDITREALAGSVDAQLETAVNGLAQLRQFATS